MHLSAAEIETIVNVVVGRLRGLVRDDAGNAGGNLPKLAGNATPGASTTYDTTCHDNTPGTTGRLRIATSPVTWQDLRDQMSGVQVVEVSARAVVTPAVLDELRDRGIQLHRAARLTESDGRASTSAIENPQMLLLGPIARRLEHPSIEFTPSTANSAADVCRIAAHLNSGGRGAIWCSPTPYAASRAATANSSLLAIHLGSIQSLPQAVREADPNVLILDDAAWESSDLQELTEIWKGRSR